jgi:hypothetical protein
MISGDKLVSAEIDCCDAGHTIVAPAELEDLIAEPLGRMCQKGVPFITASKLNGVFS